MVEGSVGVLGRADCHRGEVQGGDGVGGDGGGYGGGTPVTVGLVYEYSCSHEGKKDDKNPD